MYEAMPRKAARRCAGGSRDLWTAARRSSMPDARPVRDFRGWLWQNGQCRDLPPHRPASTGTSAAPSLARLRDGLPAPHPLLDPPARRAVPRGAVSAGRALVWPPEDLGQMRVRVEMLAPGEDARPLFDSNAPGAQLAASLGDLSRSLLPGERVQIRKMGSDEASALTLRASRCRPSPPAPLAVAADPLAAAGGRRRGPGRGTPPEAPQAWIFWTRPPATTW